MPQVKVYITLNSVLRRYAKSGTGSEELLVPDGSSVRDVLKTLPIMPGEVGLILLNADTVTQDERVNDGDILELFPIVGGG